MRGIFWYTVALLLLSGCASNDADRPSADSADPLDTLGVELPEEIRQLDNLTVYPVDDLPKSRITFEEEVRFGDTEEVLLGHIQTQNVLIDDQGRIFIGDSGWGHRGIHVYAPDGSFIKTMGGEGKGPGEIMDVSNMGITGDELHLYDDNLDRINVYSLETLEFSHSQLLDPRNWNHLEAIQSSNFSHCYFLSDGTYLAGFVEHVNPGRPEENRKIRYYRMNQEGEIISDKILEQRSLKFLRTQTSRFTLEHTRQSLLSLSDSDGIIGAWTEDFLLKRYDSKGRYQSAVYYPHQRKGIEEQEILSRYDEYWENNQEGIRMYRDRIRGANLPDRWPALNSMLVDDEDRIWISTVDNHLDTFTWWVLEDSGELIARFTRPQNHSVVAVKDGYAYILIEEGGGEEVVRYRLSFNPAESASPEMQ